MADLTIAGNDLKLRLFTPKDRNYVLSTWLRSLSDRAPRGVRIFGAVRPKVEHVVDNGNLLVLCDERSPGTIYAWIASIHGFVEWYYVQYHMRHNGIGKFMVQKMAEFEAGLKAAEGGSDGQEAG